MNTTCHDIRNVYFLRSVASRIDNINKKSKLKKNNPSFKKILLLSGYCASLKEKSDINGEMTLSI